VGADPAAVEHGYRDESVGAGPTVEDRPSASVLVDRGVEPRQADVVVGLVPARALDVLVDQDEVAVAQFVALLADLGAIDLGEACDVVMLKRAPVECWRPRGVGNARSVLARRRAAP